MKNFEVIIGVEVHIVLKTNTKMFSYAKNTHHQEPNTAVSWMDLALPGILPRPNKKAIEKGIILADALKMNINYKNIQFDRKNYFYVDLPKGFQITQQYYPIGSYGKIKINNEKIVTIERIHLEEDTAKKINENNKLLMDYNRAGIPLIEIVSTPCLHSADEVYDYLSELKRILIFKDISDAKMEDGSMRVDVNISLRPFGVDWYNNKVEIKNINSLNNVKKAINFEIKRQTKLLLTNNIVNQETRRFNDINGETEFMREKSNAVDYRYITEPNIINLKLDDDYVSKIIKESNKSPEEISIFLKEKLQFDQEKIDLLLDNYDLYNLFTKINDNFKNESITIYNWLANEIAGLLDKFNLNIAELNDFQIEQLIDFFKKLIIKKEINSKQAKNLLFEFFNQSEKTFSTLIKELGYEQISDPNIIKNIILSYMDKNKSMLDQYAERPERVEKFFVGMVMKETNSQANPNVTMTLLKELLNSK